MNLGDKKAFIFARLGVRIKEGFLSRYFLSVSACLSTNKGIKCPQKKSVTYVIMTLLISIYKVITIAGRQNNNFKKKTSEKKLTIEIDQILKEFKVAVKLQ